MPNVQGREFPDNSSSRVLQFGIVLIKFVPTVLGEIKLDLRTAYHTEILFGNITGVSPPLIPIRLFWRTLGEKLTLFRLIPPLMPTEKLWRCSPICALAGKAHVPAKSAVPIIVFSFIFLQLQFTSCLSSNGCKSSLIKIELYQFKVFGETYKEYFPVDKSAPVVYTLELEAGLNGTRSILSSSFQVPNHIWTGL